MNTAQLQTLITIVATVFVSSVLVPEAIADRWQDRPLADSRPEQPVHLFEPIDLQVADGSSPASAFTPDRIKELMRPSVRLNSEWQAKVDDIGLSSHGASLSVPTYPFFGPPPPFVTLGFNYTGIDAPVAFHLPADLYESQIGFAWMRKINNRWMTRLMAGASFGTDGTNTSGDAWQFRGGWFAIYRRRPDLTWTFGVMALGRNDLPVVPAVGVIYQPTQDVRFDLIMPRPKIAFLLADNGPRQQWVYLGAGLNGSTWGVERASGVDDQLTYGDVRVMLGWESIPTPEPGMPFTQGRKFGVEAGYVFSRDFEFEDASSKIKLDDTFMLRGTVSF